MACGVHFDGFVRGKMASWVGIGNVGMILNAFGRAPDLYRESSCPIRVYVSMTLGLSPTSSGSVCGRSPLASAAS